MRTLRSMNFVRTYSSLGCPDATLDEALALAAAHGLQGVELRALEGSVDLPAVLARRFGTPAAFAARVAAQPLRVFGLNTSLKLCGSDEAAWAGLDAFLPWAEALGGVRLRVFDGGTSGEPDELDTMAARLCWWYERRTAQGLKSDLMIETHDSLFSAAKIKALAARFASPPILWDTHHTWKRGSEDPVTTWREIRPWVVHLHVKDSVSIPSAKHPFSYVLPGKGEFSLAPLLKQLAADRCDKPISLEWERLWHPTLPTLDEALTAARAWW